MLLAVLPLQVLQLGLERRGGQEPWGGGEIVLGFPFFYYNGMDVIVVSKLGGKDTGLSFPVLNCWEKNGLGVLVTLTTANTTDIIPST